MKFHLKNIILFTVTIFFSYLQLSFGQQKFSNPKQLTRILFLLDGSQSMMNSWDRGSRMDAAKHIIGNIADSLSKLPNVEMGLRVYGHQFEQSLGNCHDTKLEVTITKNNVRYIKKKLESLKPKGITPIALSLQKCATDFPATPSRNVVIIITDGAESCGGDPCAIAKALQQKGIILKPFVVGLGIASDLSGTLDCIGQYRDAPDSKAFENIMTSIIATVLNRTSAEVDLLDNDKKPTETNVNMTFYDSQTMIVKYEMYHQMNARGNPDTIALDPIGKYNLDVHTIPPVQKNNIEIAANQHTIIPLDAPQGSLHLVTAAKQPIKCIVRQANGLNTIHVQNFNSTDRYLTGKYDLEIITLPRIILKGIEIKQTQINSIAIPAPGTLAVERNGEGFGGVFYMKDNVWIKLYEFKFKVFSESINLQPGQYRIIYRAKANKRMKQTVSKDFTIKSNQTVTIGL